jgi:hypothetical protein
MNLGGAEAVLLAALGYRERCLLAVNLVDSDPL